MKKILLLSLLIAIFQGCKKNKKYVKHLYLTMGTVLVVTIPENESQYADSIYQIFKRLDHLFHPNRPSSDVSRINQNSGRWVHVAKETADCIKKALVVSRLTHGAFDITIGKLVQLWHFEQEGKYAIPPKDSIQKYKKYVDYRKIKVDGDSVFIEKGQSITLSGIAKGYALDLVKDYLKKHKVSSCLVNAGGDLLILGKRNGKKWRIGIQSPWENSYIKIIDVKDKFVATSGNYTRYLRKNDSIFAHIFNPLTGEPLKYRKLSITVIADSGYLADGLATAISVLGKKEAKDLADSLKVGLIAVFDTDTVINSVASFYVEPSR